MNIKRIAGIIAVLAVFLAVSTAQAATRDEEDTRYFIQTTKSFWKNTFSARHVFKDGFSADLSDWQLRIARIAGLKVTLVKKLSVLPDEAISGKKKPTPTPRLAPADQVSWGVRMIYNDMSEFIPSGGASVSVAVLDTGVDVNHPDLKNRISACKDFTGSKPNIIDGKCEDKNGHGTHVAGIIAADGGPDGTGIYGVAPETKIYAFKACNNNGSCWADDISVAIVEAADFGANIINLSLGSDTQSSLITDAVDYAVSKGVIVIAAAGNDGPYQDSIDYPAALANVVGVGAIDSSMLIPDWSSRGNNTETEPYIVQDRDIEFAAPGENIESTFKDGGYVILSGTSMAAPHVAGLAAKLWQFDAENPAQATREILQFRSFDISPMGDDNNSGYGLPTI